MIFTVIGETDRRPVIYTLLRLMSTYGETSLVTNNNKLLVLSDTKESGGYYGDSQINWVESTEDYDIHVESLFYHNFLYDGLMPIFSDILFYCTQQAITKKELQQLQKYNVRNVVAVELYSDKTNFFTEDLNTKLKSFEKDRTYTVISDPLCDFIAKNIYKKLRVEESYVYQVLTSHAKKKKGILPFNLKLSLKRG